MPEAVGAVFRAQNLMWSTGQAVRVLADVECAEAEPAASASSPWVLGWSWWLYAATAAEAVARRRAAEQLSLFDA